MYRYMYCSNHHQREIVKMAASCIQLSTCLLVQWQSNVSMWLMGFHGWFKSAQLNFLLSVVGDIRI